MQGEEYPYPRRGDMYDASDEGEEEALANDAGNVPLAVALCLHVCTVHEHTNARTSSHAQARARTHTRTCTRCTHTHVAHTRNLSKFRFIDIRHAYSLSLVLEMQVIRMLFFLL